MSFNWPARLLQSCAFLSSISLLLRGPALDGAVLLPWASLMSLVHMTLPAPEIPLDQFIPWWSLLVITVVALGNAESPVKDALGLQGGRFDGGPLLWSILCVVISTVALVAWSWWVRGDHGPIQEILAPLMTPTTVLPFAVINAFREEAQFRMLFLGASIAGEAEKSVPLMAYVMTIHSMYFALLHFLGGFPTGHSGFALVFIWSLFLDILRAHAKLYVTAIACLAYGLSQYNEMVRCTVAGAGNDHRLGAQEAPPAIISLYPGQGFETFMESIVAGGDLLGYKAEKKKQATGCSAAMHIEAPVEDRNRTAPFPFCGNRFEFRAVGSSQNCCFPVMVCNAIMSAGMAHMAGLIEGGMSHRDAVAQVFKENKHVIFTGNGYSAEWPVEAEKRGLPNLNTTPKAIATWNSVKNKKLLETLKIYTEEETEARQEVMYENYISSMCCEVETMVQMTETGFLPACAKDLEKYKGFEKLAGSRKTVYESIVEHLEKLKTSFSSKPHGGLPEEALYLCDTVKPLMAKLRTAVDAAENLMEQGVYPYPTYEAMIYSHHF